MALKYSETFKISSRGEASVVLKLTQHLSDSLEKYFLNCKELKIVPSCDYGNKKIALESTVGQPQLDIEPTLSTNAQSLSGLHENIKVSPGENHPGFQNRKLHKFEDPDEIPIMSSQSIEFPLPVKGFSSQPCPSTSPYYSNINKSNAHVYGLSQVEQNSENSSYVSQSTLHTEKGIKANSESKPPQVSTEPQIKTQFDLYVENNESQFNRSSLHDGSQETPSSTQAQRKTSKTLSPDILQLLKGKDANTVSNILKTLSPFYPALQDVNLEILAQVLVNTGALD